MKYDFPIQVPIMVTSDEQLQKVYAVLAGADLRPHTTGSGNVTLSAPTPAAGAGIAGASEVIPQNSAASGTQESPQSDGNGSIATTSASPSDEPDSDEVDAHGWPWSADLHASTRSQTKEGLWRMKVGVSRPDPKPGFPKDETPSETSTPSPANETAAGATEPAGSSPTEEPASAAASQEEDDEFAAFRAAAAKADAVDNAAAASVPERVWTDADLGALCNQAAVKMNDPAPVKAIIAEFVPAGEVAHSRNVPADKRGDFVKAVEAKAGIEFAD